MDVETLVELANLTGTAALIAAFLYMVVRCRVSINCNDEDDQQG